MNESLHYHTMCIALFHSVLSSLNLPAAIEDLGGDAIPASLLEKSREIQAKGGLQAIDKLFADLPELLQRNTEILDEVTVLAFEFSLPWITAVYSSSVSILDLELKTHSLIILPEERERHCGVEELKIIYLYVNFDRPMDWYLTKLCRCHIQCSRTSKSYTPTTKVNQLVHRTYYRNQHLQPWLQRLCVQHGHYFWCCIFH